MPIPARDTPLGEKSSMNRSEAPDDPPGSPTSVIMSDGPSGDAVGDGESPVALGDALGAVVLGATTGDMLGDALGNGCELQSPHSEHTMFATPPLSRSSSLWQ